MPDYQPPVSRLLRCGEPPVAEKSWRHYLDLGLGLEHVPELVRMVRDRELNEGDPETADVWAPIHAWRTLGQLGAVEAVGPLLEALQEAEDRDDDWGLEELPEVFARLGPAVAPALGDFLADAGRGLYSRWAVADALKRIARQRPEARDECVRLLTRQLEQAQANDPTLNGALVGNLCDLKAVEAAPLLERTFTAGLVDESIGGGWEHARYDLGFRPDPPEGHIDYIRRHSPELLLGRAGSPRARADKRAKAKRKEAKKARKRNRKKK
ncbi:MAG TPA: hypothetical protein VFE78_29760 [Gemmataceae bacterium]|jgi:hypothetical protein|nr:hypothetical protein [Gemmataceae bacterium]